MRERSKVELDQVILIGGFDMEQPFGKNLNGFLIQEGKLTIGFDEHLFINAQDDVFMFLLVKTEYVGNGHIKKLGDRFELLLGNILNPIRFIFGNGGGGYANGFRHILEGFASLVSNLTKSLSGCHHQFSLYLNVQ